VLLDEGDGALNTSACLIPTMMMMTMMILVVVMMMTLCYRFLVNASTFLSQNFPIDDNSNDDSSDDDNIDDYEPV